MILKALVVDDSLTVRGYHSQILQEAGFAVEQSVNGYEALEKTLLDFYHLLVIDINMPKLDGVSLLKQLRQREEYTDTPVLVASTETGEQDIRTGLAAGATIYLSKPIHPEILTFLAKIFTAGSGGDCD
ncbi:response regulator [Desulfallas sp. Bu1-1]|uniref:response regulator n=1 Tax=Desulfallas sp. Bu1-1 TaxID=2787620 RepID=UPI0018A0E521|nr:response regulator [Desulfallas sp. Bu1-1]MBF7084204.1 response regulator [Desulfallas sp. Bu1-1]